jgi:diguanylate cyclase (GGDEF)-like protein
MTIDIRTLFLALALNCGLAGVVFVFHWLRRGQGIVSLRAGVAALLIAFGTGLLVVRGLVADRISIDLANALLTAGLGLGWAAARGFVGRQAPAWAILAGAFVWLLACSVPEFYAGLGYRIALVSAVAAAYAFAAGSELLRFAPKSSRSARALALLCLFHGVVVSLHALNVLIVGEPAGVFDGSFVYSLFMVEPALMIFAIALLGVGLVRDRHETELRRHAETDPLTGVLNRRGFLDSAERDIARARSEQRPIGLLLFDLDHFKTVNDRFGHLAGDRALVRFAALAVRAIRANDLIGRIGGEEFAALLNGVDMSTATVIAERIRADFATLGIEHDGMAIPATVSAGVAVASGAGADLGGLLAEADRALYGAKGAGRDRVHGALALAS